MIAHRLMDRSLNDLRIYFRLKPTMFFDLTFSRESANEKSKENRSEAEFICQLLISLCKGNIKDDRLLNLRGKIGIISPYKS